MLGTLTYLGVYCTSPKGGLVVAVRGYAHRPREADTVYVIEAYERGRHAMLGLIISIIIVGLIAGALARLVVPGRQNLSIAMTIVIGIIGSFVGGFLGYLLFGKDAGSGLLQPAGIIGSIIGAIIVLLIWTRVS